MAEDMVKLTYIAGQYRIRVQLTRATATNLVTPPNNLVARARQKMLAVKHAGEIKVFSVYESRFSEFWQRCIDKKDLPPNEPINFTLAEGSPTLDGISLKQPGAQGSIATLVVTKPAHEARHWRLEWLFFWVDHQLKSMKISDKCDPAQLHGVWLQLMAGEQLSEVPLAPAPPPPAPEEAAESPYSIIANHSSKEISLIVRDINRVVEHIGIEKILGLISDASDKATGQSGGTYRLLREEVSQRIRQSLSGPEVIGMDLPLVLLAASAYPGSEANPPPAAPFSTTTRSHGKAEKLRIAISSDSMQATVEAFSQNLFQAHGFSVTQDWLKGEIARYGISEEASKPYVKGLIDAILHQEIPTGMLIAMGSKSQGGQKPYLHSSFEDAADTEGSNTDQTINLRNTQNKSFVKSGQLIASLQYQIPPTQGKNVFGETLAPAKDDDFSITIGDGIEERSPGRYYALFDGVPVIGKGSLSLAKMMVHKGDINLSTGNIIFDGPLEVIGSIDTGSWVQVSGDLTVKGSIRNAFIRCGGNLEVGAGIVTGRNGLIRAAGDIRAEFIENSKIQCGGSLIVKKAVLNCNVIAGGQIKLLDKSNSVIAGGMISCRQNLYTATLGFKNGTVTEVNTGVDWKTELSVQNRSHRIDNILKIQLKDRQLLREVLSRKKSQMTEKHENRKKHYQKRLIKSRDLLAKMKIHLKKARSQLVYDRNVKIFVYEILFANVDIHVGGTPVPVVQDAAGIAIIGKRKRGSTIIPIEAALKMEKEQSDNDSQDEG